MKLRIRQISTVLAFVCAFLAQADDVVSSENVFGLLAVNSTTTNTIVATPWLAPGAGSVVVSNLVKTTNLLVNDKLYVINGSTSNAFYEGWTLASGAGGNYWSPIGKFTLNANGTMTQDPGVSASVQAVVRGQGVWLVRQDPASGPFYLYGQHTNAAASTAVTAGTSEAPAWNLVGNASASAVAVNSKITSNVDAKDTIVIPTDNAPIVLKYESSAWGYSASSNYTHASGQVISVPYRVTNVTIPAGTGFWYVSRGGNPTITW